MFRNLAFMCSYHLREKKEFIVSSPFSRPNLGYLQLWSVSWQFRLNNLYWSLCYLYLLL